MTTENELLKQADEQRKLRGLANDAESRLLTVMELERVVARQDVVIKALADEVRGVRHEREFIYKQVERGLFDKHTGTKTALENIAYYPEAPWSEDSSWDWDVTHTPYSAEFYKKFPSKQPPKED